MADAPEVQEKVQKQIQDFFGLSSLAMQMRMALTSPEAEQMMVRAGTAVGTAFKDDLKTILSDLWKDSVKPDIEQMVEEKVAGSFKAALEDLGIGKMVEEMKVQMLLGVDEIKAKASESLQQVSEELSLLSESLGKVGTILRDEMSAGIKAVMDDPDYMNLIVATISDNIVGKLIGDENVKGSIADAVFGGMRRVSSDAESQRNLASIVNMVVASQQFTNQINGAIDTAYKRQKDLMTGADVQKTIREAVKQSFTDNLAALQEVLNTIVSEAVVDLKKVRVSFHGTLSE